MWTRAAAALALLLAAGGARAGSLGAPTNIVQVGGQGLTLGQKPAALSVPVVLSGDQSIILVALPAGTTVYGPGGVALATEATLASVLARANLLATEATLATRASESTLVAVSTTATAIKNRADLLAEQATAAAISTTTTALLARANLLNVETTQIAVSTTLAAILTRANILATEASNIAIHTQVVAINANTVGLSTTASQISLTTIAISTTNTALLARANLLATDVTAIAISTNAAAINANTIGLSSTTTAALAQLVAIDTLTVTQNATLVAISTTNTAIKARVDLLELDATGVAISTNVAALPRTALQNGATALLTIERPFLLNQADAGRMFVVNTGTVNVTPANSDLPVLLLVNLSTNTRTAKANRLFIGNRDTADAALFRVWAAPVVTSSGTAIPIYNTAGLAATSQMQAYRSPTISAASIALFEVIAGPESTLTLEPDMIYQLRPGSRLLFTANTLNNNNTVLLSVSWMEE